MASGGHVIDVAMVGLASQVVEVSCGGDDVGSAEAASAVVAALTGWTVWHMRGGGYSNGAQGFAHPEGWRWRRLWQCSVEGVAMGVEVAVMVMGMTGCATYRMFTQGASIPGGINRGWWQWQRLWR
ncbi:hypothetical protein EDB89DRAFT_1913292 [Lactarius sanguifluus]|nr:hypothetical protein EDB89DRAFT_1913292 [Lactarius sanguifluus]